MTICIAAKAGKEHVVVASDRMVTLMLPSTEFEQGIPKTLQITSNCLASMAGSALAYTPIYTNAKSEIDRQSIHEIGQIAEINRKFYVLMRNAKMEQDILGKIGITLQDFYNMNRQLAPEIVAYVTQAMGQYNYNLSILIAGVDSDSHIYRIDNPGRIEIFDSIGHCSVGSGELHAISTFVANDYRHDLDVNHVVALTYEAKKRSEKAQGVGEASDIYIICKDHSVKLPENKVKELDDIWNKRSEQERRAVEEIQEKIKALDILSLDKTETQTTKEN